MPTRKSDAHKGDVSALAAGADDTSQTNVVDDSILSTATTQADREKSITEGSTGNKKGKEAAAVENDKITIEDLTLPKSIITRLAKGVLPANTQIQANAIMAMSKSTTVFISYLAAHANEITLNANKKTIMPADVFKALEEIEFDFLKEPLEAEFAKQLYWKEYYTETRTMYTHASTIILEFNAIQTDKRNTYRQKVKAATKPTGANEDEDDTDMAGGDTSTAAAATAATTASKAAASNGDSDEAPRSKKARVDALPAPEETTDADEDAVEETDEDEKEELEEDEEEEEEEEDEEDEEDEGGEGRDSSEETQDALEEGLQGEEPDEALDGDESD